MSLIHLNILELSDKIKNKEISAVEVTRAVLEHIKEKDGEYNSFITVTEEEAIRQAIKVQEKIDKGQLSKSPIAGVPMAIKDNICTKNIRTSCASKMLETFIPSYNATVMDKLEGAGGILLGKLNMDECAMGSSSDTSYFGPTKNPVNTQYSPGGSSGGSAAAVAASQGFYSLGSDTGGSIRQPSSYCGVTGIKPTYGSVSRYGLIPFASSFDQIGPIAKDISGATAVLDVIKGYDPKDSTSVNKQYPTYLDSLVDDVKGMRIAIPKDIMDSPMDEVVREKFEEAIEIFKNKGAIIQIIELDTIDYVIPAYYILSSAEASSNLSRFDGIRYGYRSPQGGNIEEIYRKSRSEGFGQEVKYRVFLGAYVLSPDNYEDYYSQALKVRRLIKNEFDQVFSKYDIVILPSNFYTASKIDELDKEPIHQHSKADNKYTIVANMIGGPAISIPCGFDNNNLPIGLQLIGRQFGEEDIIRAAYSFETARKGCGHG